MNRQRASEGRVEQCAILVGGLGSRLGPIAQDTPKPLLPVAGRPFLDRLLQKAASHDLRRVLLLCGHRAEVVAAYLQTHAPARRFGLEIETSVEPSPLGTAGALVRARSRLDPAFLLLNGDTWFDFDWRDLADAESHPCTLALRAVALADRYETVTLDGDRVTGFRPRGGREAALINGGVYRLRRDTFAVADGPLSLETHVLPALAAQGRLGGLLYDGAFIDIGVPETYAAAQALFAGG